MTVAPTVPYWLWSRSNHLVSQRCLTDSASGGSVSMRVACLADGLDVCVEGGLKQCGAVDCE